MPYFGKSELFQLCNHPLCSALSCVLWRRNPCWCFCEIQFRNRQFVIAGMWVGEDPPPPH